MVSRTFVPVTLFVNMEGLTHWRLRCRARFLHKNEKIVETGLVIKRRKLTAKKRRLFLTDTPRIFYIDPDTLEVKGDIPWTSELWVKVRNDRDFLIMTVSRAADLGGAVCAGRTALTGGGAAGAEVHL